MNRRRRQGQAGVLAGSGQQYLVMTVASLQHFVNQERGARDVSSCNRLSRPPNRIAHPPDLHAPTLGGEGENAVRRANVPIPWNSDRSDVGDQQPAHMTAAGKVQMAEGAGRRLEVLEVVAQNRIIQRRLERVLPSSRTCMANVQILSATRRVADTERQLNEFADVCFTQLIARPKKQVRLPAHAVPIAATQVVS